MTIKNKKTPTKPQHYDTILITINHIPNNKNLDTNKTNIKIDDHNFIHIDKQLHTNIPHIFTIDDIVDQPILTHKNIHENHITTKIIADKKHYFDPKIIPSIAYTEPKIT